MDAVFAILLVITVANFTLVGFVLWHNPRAEVNGVFALTAISTGIWTLTNALFRITPSPATALLSAQISYLAAILLGASILHFSWTFPLHRIVSLRHKGLLWIAAIIIGLMPFVPGLVIRSITLAGTRSIETTPTVYVIAAFLMVTIGCGFGLFAERHSSLRHLAREQSRYVLAGLGLSTIAGLVCNLLLPLLHDYRLVWLGPASSLFFVAFSVYAIMAHHLFDIRFVIKKTLVYSILVALVGALYSVAEHSLTEFLSRFSEHLEFAWLANIVGALIVAMLFAPLKQWIEKRVSRLIYKDHRQHNQRHRNAVE